MLQIKYFPGEGYNYQYMPDYRFYCDEKILRPLSSFYDYPFRTRVWLPYRNLKVFFDYMPSRLPLWSTTNKPSEILLKLMNWTVNDTFLL
ncbi:hypothetical protein NQ317_004063 [Molorchus minor]|uniref:Uncharacterized protein n=1 Tax=Molorchus minor TaxID=1323400 RepID=A0ABQ9JMP6_9CUCU|nr:hypothetical protein NQ317_004063 [Molorchus minor]